MSASPDIIPSVQDTGSLHAVDAHAATPAAEAHGEAKPAQPQQSRWDRMLGRKPESPKPATAEGGPKLTQADVISGGSTKVEVKFDQKTTDDLVNKLTARIKAVQTAQGRGMEPSDLDKHLLAAGLIEKIQSGNMSREDYLSALAVINSDMLEKSAMRGSLIPGDKSARLTNPARPKSAMGIASPYAQELDYMPTVKEIEDLDSLRVQMVEAAFGKGAKDPLFDSVNTSLYPTQLLNSRHDLYGEIGRQAQMILARDFPPGTTLEQVWTHDRPRMAMILVEANGNALKFIVRDRAETILRDPAAISSEAIKERANELRAKPKPEELEPLAATKEKADTALTEATTARDNLKKELDQAIIDVRTRGTAKEIASKKMQENGPRLTANIDRLRNESADLKAKLGALGVSTVPAGAKGTTTVSPANAMEQTIKGLEAQILDYETRLAALNDANIEAEQSYLSAVHQVDRIRGKEIPPASPGDPITYERGELANAEDAVTAATTEANTAKAVVEAKQKELAGKSVAPEKEQKAGDLEAWGEAHGHISEVRATMGKQTASEPYSFAKIKDTSISADGNITGFDKIREAIFFSADPKKALSPEQYRRMLPDQALALLILKVYRKNPAYLRGVTGVPLGVIAQAAESYDREIERLSAIPTRDAVQEASLANFRNAKRDASIQLAMGALSQINEREGTIKLAELAHEIIVSGAEQAMRGESRLKVS